MATPILSGRRKGLYLFEHFISELQIWKRVRKTNITDPLSISLGRQPSVNVSSVTNSAENLARLARSSIDAVMSLCWFPGQYNWNHRVPEPFAFATSSMLVLLAVLMMKGTLHAAAARAVASSPSGLKIPVRLMVSHFGLETKQFVRITHAVHQPAQAPLDTAAACLGLSWSGQAGHRL